MANVLELRDVFYEYDPKTPFATAALNGIDLGFREGCITGVIGHTGSGKSTLVKLLNGLARPTAGEVLLDGRNIWEKPKEITAVRFAVGLVMQYPEYQLFDATVRADIAFGPKNMGLSADEIAARVAEAAAFVGLDDDLLDKSPFDLSGGQRRRVAIAGVIAMKPRVLILDEPAAGLDPRGRREILSGLWEYGKKSGTTLILVSHSMEDMAMYCDRAIVMSHAKVVTSGTCEQVFSQHKLLLDVGLDVPEITGIILALREKGVDIPDNIYTVDGAVNAIKSQYLSTKNGRGV